MKPNLDKAPHILNASSNLVGFCFVVLTSLKFFSKHEKSILDECTLIVLVLFMASRFFSFLAIRNTGNAGNTLEKIAEYAFAGGMAILLLITIFYSFDMMI